MNSFTAGGIRCPEAYAQGKMLDHSWWSGKMRGRITPSDIDMLVESYGSALFCELSRDHDCLEDLATGQRILLQTLARLNGTHCVALLRHGLFSMSKPIDTANDIISATIYFDAGTKSVGLDGSEWREFAVAWTFNAKQAIDTVLRPKIAD